MHDQDYIEKAKLNPASEFKRPMNVARRVTSRRARSSPFSRRGKPTSERSSARKTKAWEAASTLTCTGCKRP